MTYFAIPCDALVPTERRCMIVAALVEEKVFAARLRRLGTVGQLTNGTAYPTARHRHLMTVTSGTKLGLGRPTSPWERKVGGMCTKCRSNWIVPLFTLRYAPHGHQPNVTAYVGICRVHMTRA